MDGGKVRNMEEFAAKCGVSRQTVSRVMTYFLTVFQVDANEVEGGKRPEVCDV